MMNLNRVRASALQAALVLAVIWSPGAHSAGDAVRGKTLFDVTYKCNACHDKGVVPQPGVFDISSGGTVQGLIDAIMGSPVMYARYVDTLAVNATDLADVAAYIASGSRSPALDLNQHGLTGSWYEPATSGQGFEIEVFANPSSGTGSAFVSWFTYDTVGGGAERQRWYTAQGQVATGQASASLTVYQNTGGNFNALPVTNSQAVGTASLSFDTCTSGQLVYNFIDGTGRAGTIPLSRLTQNVTCSSTTPHSTDADFALSGNWYASATSGQGMTMEVNPISGTVFATWYTYAPNGAGAGVAGQRWYTAQPTTFVRGMRSIPVTIYETTGGLFDIPTPTGQKSVAVGTGTIAFQSCSAATFSYNFTAGTNIGLSGVINLGRVGPVPPGCTS
jgi:hypothetical protein